MEIRFKNLSERFSGVMPEFLEEKGIACGDNGLLVDIVVTVGSFTVSSFVR